MVGEERKMSLLKRIDVELSSHSSFLMWDWEDALFASLKTPFGTYELSSDVTRTGTPPGADGNFRGGGLSLLLQFVHRRLNKQEFIGMYQSEEHAIAAARTHYDGLLLGLKRSLQARGEA